MLHLRFPYHRIVFLFFVSCSYTWAAKWTKERHRRLTNKEESGISLKSRQFSRNHWQCGIDLSHVLVGSACCNQAFSDKGRGHGCEALIMLQA